VAMTRLMFVSDVHGSDVCFRKMITACTMYKVDVALVSELTGKFIVPIVKHPDGAQKAILPEGSIANIKSEVDLKKIEDNAKAVGMYTFYTTSEKYESYKASGGYKDTEEVNKIFHDKIRERMTEWVKLAEEKLGNTNVKFFMMPGNDDYFYVDEIINGSSYVKNLESKVFEIDDMGHQIGGTGYSNMTPWKCPRDITEEELAKRLDTIASQVKDMKKFILHTHPPPYDTKLDSAPLLDENLKIVYKGGGTVLASVGSKAVRSFIEKYQPLLGLHGHIHECKGVDKIGKTPIINPGSEYITGTLSALLVNIDEKGLKGHRFLMG